MAKTEHLHQSRRATESRAYDKLRSAGVTPDNARRIASKAATKAHRSIDRRASDKR